MRSLFFLLIVLLLSTCNPTKNGHEENAQIAQIEWINFKWHQDTIEGRYYDRLGMNVPVIINDSLNYFAQFDLGANTNFLYEKNLKIDFNIKEDFNVDTTHTESYYYWLNSPNIKIGNKKSSLKRWVVLNNYNANDIIGTIGAEELKDKCLIIDYPNQKLSIMDSINKNYLSKFKTFDFKINNGKIIIEATINDEKYDINFDTVTSITPLLVRQFKTI